MWNDGSGYFEILIEPLPSLFDLLVRFADKEGEIGLLGKGGELVLEVGLELVVQGLELGISEGVGEEGVTAFRGSRSGCCGW